MYTMITTLLENIIRMTKSMTMKWAGNKANTDDVRNIVKHLKTIAFFCETLM